MPPPPPPPPSCEPFWLLSWPPELLLLDEPEPEGDDELADGAGALDEENCGALAGVAVVVGCEGLEEAALLGAAVEPEPGAPEELAPFEDDPAAVAGEALVGDVAAVLLLAVSVFACLGFTLACAGRRTPPVLPG